MIQNYKCNEIKIKCSEFSHTIDATFLKIRSALSHAFIAKCFRSEISLDHSKIIACMSRLIRRIRQIGRSPNRANGPD